MKKLIASVSLLALIAFVGAFHPSAAEARGGLNNPVLQFAERYAQAVGSFTVGDRTFLVMPNPTSELDIRAKIVWLERQKLAQDEQDLAALYQ